MFDAERRVVNLGPEMIPPLHLHMSFGAKTFPARLTPMAEILPTAPNTLMPLVLGRVVFIEFVRLPAIMPTRVTEPYRFRLPESMKNWELTEESFNLFLSWLAPDRDTAGKKYEDLRRRLIIMLDGRGCTDSEGVADETFNRFIRRLPEMIDSYTGDPIPYLCVIARHVHLELRKKQTAPLPENLSEVLPAANGSDELENRLHECLEKCLEKLELKSRELVLDYYQEERQAKIAFRKRLARQMGIAANALRIRMHRIRTALESCINDCLGTDLPAEIK